MEQTRWFKELGTDYAAFKLEVAGLNMAQVSSDQKLLLSVSCFVASMK